ncbi:sensor histidine kinase [Luteitalea sp.]|uniref:sensor histidine kinase n=1 Tax=Luteitalea sp. TaxID=2004800 RepID=UPI0025C6F91D|nr:sensor histidine kinase [Luteitalea sp.]
MTVGPGSRCPRRRIVGLGHILWALAAVVPALAVAAPAAPRDNGWVVDRWDVEHGLPINGVSDLLQTDDGYLWVATWAGLVRFDGVRFTPVPGTLPSSHIRALLADRDGSVWIGMGAGGLVRWRNGRVDTVIAPKDVQGHDVSSLARDAAGRVWVGTERSISVVDNGRVTTLDRSHGMPEDVSGVLATGVDGRIWIQSPSATCHAIDLTVHCRARTVAGRPTAILPDRNGRVWVGTARGLFVDDATVASTARCQGRPCVLTGAVSALFESRDGTVWVGFANGDLVSIAADATRRWQASVDVPAGQLVAFHEDREGSLWVGTTDGGLTRLKRARVATYGTAEGLPAPVVGSIVADASGTIHVGSNCGPVSSLQGDRFVPRFVEHLGDACAWVLLPARDGSLWIGTRGSGLFHWSTGRMERYGPAEGLSDTTVRGLFEDRDGVIWIGTETGGLHRFEGGRLSRAYGPEDGVATYLIASFAQDRDGRVWIGSNGNGLSVFEGGRFRTLPAERHPPTRDIAGLLIDSRGDLWIGSAADGLFRLRQGRFEPFGLAQGLGDRLVAVMVEDLDANLWVGTARGIARLERQRIEAVAAGREQGLAPIVLDRTDGMRHVEGSGGGFHPSGWRDRRGRLWFSTLEGIVVIDPSTFAINRTAPTVVIESGVVDDRVVVMRDGVLRIPPGSDTVEIAYTASSMLAPAKVQFRYRLRGFDTQWHAVGGRRTAYFTRLTPGDYVFEVEASNNDGVWSTTMATVGVEVLPLLWERAGVRLGALGVLLLVTGAVVSAASQRRARRRLDDLERARALDRERTRIARDLHDDLGSRLSHIALLADRDSQPAASGLASAARNAVEVLDELVWAVNARNDTVESFAAYTGRFVEDHVSTAGLRYRTSRAGDLSRHELAADARRHLYLAVKEVVHNAVKHAAASEIALHIGADAAALTIRVMDNGRGMPTDGGDPTGTGCASTRERLAAVGGTVTWRAGQHGGTEVTLRVPLRAY